MFLVLAGDHRDRAAAARAAAVRDAPARGHGAGRVAAGSGCSGTGPWCSCACWASCCSSPATGSSSRVWPPTGPRLPGSPRPRSGSALAANTAVIVVAQFVVLRLVERRRRSRVIAAGRADLGRGVGHRRVRGAGARQSADGRRRVHHHVRAVRARRGDAVADAWRRWWPIWRRRAGRAVQLGVRAGQAAGAGGGAGGGRAAGAGDARCSYIVMLRAGARSGSPCWRCGSAGG